MSRGHFVDTFNAKMLNNVLKSFTHFTQTNPIKKSLDTALLRKFKAFSYSGPDGN